MRTIIWKNGLVVTIEQTKLPEKLVYIKLRKPPDIAKAIKNMKIRGAPLLGAAAALSLAQTAYFTKAKTKESLLKELEKTSNLIRATRPTAVNLFNSLKTILGDAETYEGKLEDFKKFVVQKSLEAVKKDVEVNRTLSLKGAQLIGEDETILTHCNAGELATVQHGTALGVLKMAYKQGKNIKVIVTETRPLLQGSRLTAFELRRDGIPYILITDNMVGYVMWRGMVNRVIVGADRILTSGHIINKIGTYTIAVLAKKHGIPFYTAAPTSTIDPEKSVEEIIIEERDPKEITEFRGQKIAPKGVKVFNPAFDITPPELVTGIITEKGVIPPNSEDIKRIYVEI